MLISKESLIKEAKEKGYKPEILEKVYRLLDTFQQFLSVPYLKKRLVLKGGTALNLFYFDKAPCLSVDIDLNYIGHLDREVMLAERQTLIQAIHQIMQMNQFESYRAPTHHAGGKMVWFYNSVLAQRGLLEIDINFMYRQPLWPIVFKKPNIQTQSEWFAPVLDIHELTAGKLAALFDRHASRDLFDAHFLFKNIQFNLDKLRFTLVVYLAMTKIDLSILKPDFIQYDLTDLKNRLLPVLHQKSLPRTQSALLTWSNKLISELKDNLSLLLPLRENEIEFITQIRIKNKIKAELITNDLEMVNKINQHPGLLWAMKREKSVGQN